MMRITLLLLVFSLTITWLPLIGGQCVHSRWASKKPSGDHGRQDSTAHCVLNDSDQDLIRSTWNLVKRQTNQGPKAFLRHFDAKAAASSTQRSFDHPEGGAFISQASNCLSRLSFYLQQQKEQLGDKKPLNEGIAIKKCPALAKTLGKYNGAHREKFNVILIDALEQELGDSLTSETKKAWEKVAKAMNDAIKLT